MKKIEKRLSDELEQIEEKTVDLEILESIKKIRKILLEKK